MLPTRQSSEYLDMFTIYYEYLIGKLKGRNSTIIFICMYNFQSYIKII